MFDQFCGEVLILSEEEMSGDVLVDCPKCEARYEVEKVVFGKGISKNSINEVVANDPSKKSI